MPKSTIEQCADPTQELSLKIPCRLAERVDAYAKELESSSNLNKGARDSLDYYVRGVPQKLVF